MRLSSGEELPSRIPPNRLDAQRIRNDVLHEVFHHEFKLFLKSLPKIEHLVRQVSEVARTSAGVVYRIPLFESVQGRDPTRPGLSEFDLQL